MSERDQSHREPREGECREVDSGDPVSQSHAAPVYRLRAAPRFQQLRLITQEIGRVVIKVCAAITVGSLAIALVLGGLSALGGVASGVSGIARHAVTGGASAAPRASAVMQDEANGPGFRLRVKHRRSVVTAGAAAVYVVRLRRMYAFPYRVTLRAYGLPAGAAAGFAPRTVRPDGSSILEIRTGDTSPPGTYVFRVLAASHGLSTISAATITIR